MDWLGCYMEGMNGCFEDFVTKSLLFLTTAAGVIIAMAIYALNMLVNRPPQPYIPTDVPRGEIPRLTEIVRRSVAGLSTRETEQGTILGGPATALSVNKSNAMNIAVIKPNTTKKNTKGTSKNSPSTDRRDKIETIERSDVSKKATVGFSRNRPDTIDKGTAEERNTSDTIDNDTTEERNKSDTIDKGTAEERNKSNTIDKSTAKERNKTDTIDKGTAEERNKSDTIDKGTAEERNRSDTADRSTKKYEKERVTRSSSGNRRETFDKSTGKDKSTRSSSGNRSDPVERSSEKYANERASISSSGYRADYDTAASDGGKRYQNYNEPDSISIGRKNLDSKLRSNVPEDTSNVDSKGRQQYMPTCDVGPVDSSLVCYDDCTVKRLRPCSSRRMIPSLALPQQGLPCTSNYKLKPCHKCPKHPLPRPCQHCVKHILPQVSCQKSVSPCHICAKQIILQDPPCHNCAQHILPQVSCKKCEKQRLAQTSCCSECCHDSQ